MAFLKDQARAQLTDQEHLDIVTNVIENSAFRDQDTLAAMHATQIEAAEINKAIRLNRPAS